MLLNDIPKFIDKEYNSIAKSLALNGVDVGEDPSQAVWLLTAQKALDGGRNHDKNLKSADAVVQLKSNYLQRVNWMNNQINSWYKIFSLLAEKDCYKLLLILVVLDLLFNH